MPDIGCGVESRCLAKGYTCTGCTRNPHMSKDGLSWKHDRFYSVESNNAYYNRQ